MRNPLILAALALTGLAFNSARAEEPTLALTEQSRLSPSTFFVVAGSGNYPNAPDLTGAEGATNDCLAIAEHLRGQGLPDAQIMSACGPELVRMRLFALLQEFARRVPSGGTLFIMWIGHGGTDPQSGAKLFLATDGSFDLFVSKEGQYASSGYGHDGINVSLLYGATRQNIPTNARVVFVTDVARGGVYKANGGDILLEGPSAKDFEEMPGVLALSPTPGKLTPVGLTRHTLITCLSPQTMGLSVDTREFLECYAEGMTATGLTIEMAGTWSETTDLFIFPTPPPPAVAKKKVNAPKVALVVTGSALAAVGVAQAYLGHTEAIELGKGISAGEYGVAGDSKLATAVEHYNTLADTQPLWYAMGGAGLATIAIGIALPTTNGKETELPRTTLYLKPTGLEVQGSF